MYDNNNWTDSCQSFIFSFDTFEWKQRDEVVRVPN